jgi:hypothetical protein
MVCKKKSANIVITNIYVLITNIIIISGSIDNL